MDQLDRHRDEYLKACAEEARLRELATRLVQEGRDLEANRACADYFAAMKRADDAREALAAAAGPVTRPRAQAM